MLPLTDGLEVAKGGKLFTKGKQDGRSADGQTTPGSDIGAAHVADDAGEVGIRVDDGVLCPDVLFSGRHDE